MFRAQTLLVVVLLAFAFRGLAAEGDEKGILAELSQRKVLDADALKKRLDRLSTLTAPELEAELKLLQKEQDAVKGQWQKVDSLRRTKRPGVPPIELRTAGFALKTWQAERDGEARLQAIQDREEEAFEKRYKEPLTKFSSKHKEWITTDEYRVFEKDRADVNSRFGNRFRELAEEARHGNVDSEKVLDKIEEQILGEYDQTARALNQTLTALDAKQGKKAAPPATALFQRTDRAPTSIKPAWIRLERVPAGTDLPVGVGEPVEIVTVVDDGPYNPDLGYMVSIRSNEGLSRTSIIVGQPARRSWFVTFDSPGTRTLFGEVRTGILQRVGRGTLRVKVIQPRKAEEEKPADPPKPPPAKQDPTVPPPPPPPLLTPFSGNYLGHLWISRVPHPAMRVTPWPPTPVSLTFDTNGEFNGRCSYTAPQSLFSAVARRDTTALDWKTRFTIQGKVDWQTGKIELRIPDGHVSESRVTKYGPSGSTHEYSTNLYARHTSDPSWVKVIPNLLTAMAKSGQSPAETPGVPAVGTGPTGQPGFVDNGWFANKFLEPGFATGTVKFKSFILKGIDGKETDMTAGYNQPGNTEGWYLKLVGPDTTPQDLAKAELVGTSIWPERNTTAKVGEHVNVQFVGVFGSNYTQIRDLTNIADWQVPPGLTQVQPGVFSAAKPGQYNVRARAKGKDGVWMEGYVTIEVTGS